MPTLNPQPETLNPAAATSATIPPPSRLPALDWVKGALVLFMVVYHGINYSAFRPLAFHYLAFLPPSFILIAGFLVGQVYAAKYDLASWRPYLRLAVRGLKLMALFTLLNLAFVIVNVRSLADGLWEFTDRAQAIFLSGNGRVGIFEVLLPIAYFLLLAPVLLWTRRFSSLLVPTLAAALFATCVFVDSDNLELLSLGVIGMVLGLVPFARINALAQKWPVVLLLYAGYRYLSAVLGETYPVQTTAAITTILLLYTVGLRVSCTPLFGKQVILLGNHSLFSYLTQILLLRTWTKLLHGTPVTPIATSLMVVGVCLELWVMVLAVDTMCRKKAWVKKSYSFVFN